MRHIRSFLAILTCIVLTSCASFSPAGKTPEEAIQNNSENTRCNPIAGTYIGDASWYREGHKKQHFSILYAVAGCREPIECRIQPPREGPSFFHIQAGIDHGLTVEFFNAAKQSLSNIQLPAARVVCTKDGLTVLLHDGMAHDGPGSWTFGKEHLTVDLMLGNSGKLVARRTSKRFDVFWFGLPFVSEEGSWFVFTPAP